MKEITGADARFDSCVLQQSRRVRRLAPGACSHRAEGFPHPITIAPMPHPGPKFEKDILKLIPPPKDPPRLTSRRIGIHTSTAGGVANAAERAYRLGCNALQIFSSSPRQWAPYDLAASQCAEMGSLRERYDLKPLAIHANYLINLAGGNPE